VSTIKTIMHASVLFFYILKRQITTYVQTLPHSVKRSYNP